MLIKQIINIKNNYYTSKQHNLEDKQTYTNFRVVTK